MLPEMLSLAGAATTARVRGRAIVHRQSRRTDERALHYWVTCAEDGRRITKEQAERRWLACPSRHRRQCHRVCNVWPRGSAPADFAEPVTSDKPVLLFRAAWIRSRRRPMGRWWQRPSNSRHVVAKGYGHIVSPNACGPRLIAAFVDSAAFGNLSQSCIAYFEQSMAPPLWPDRLEPQP
jgi:hypothetical protein